MTTPINYKQVVKPYALKFQRLFARDICLISGAPRSGTSALAEWLGHQPGVAAFAESRILVSTHKFLEEAFRFKNLESENLRLTSIARQLVFDYYLNSRIFFGKNLVVDKEPLEPIAFPAEDYEKFIFNVRQILPKAKLLLAIRDPLATIWSMSQRSWGESLTSEITKRFTLEEHIENWCACAELISQYCAEPNTYIVQFGRLIHDSEQESKRIFEFLKIRNGIPFRAHPTKEIGFDRAEQEKILTMVQPQLAKLTSLGITNLF